MEEPRPLVTLRRKTEGQWAPAPQAAMRVRSGLLLGGHVCFSTSCHPQLRYLLSPSIPVFFPRRGHSMPCLTPSGEGK